MDQRPTSVPNPEFNQTNGLPPLPENYQRAGELPLASNNLEQSAEQAGKQAERPPSPVGISLPPVQPPVIPADNTTVTPTDNTAAIQVDTPLIADDVDVIEMEWVDKAKRIIKETKDDPYKQEEAVEKLQVDYLKKRYGKELKQRAQQ